MLYIVIGLTGTGKSSVAKTLAQKTKAVVLNADEFRQALFSIDLVFTPPLGAIG